MIRRIVALMWAGSVLVAVACRENASLKRSEPPPVVVYCSVDETCAKPILDDFQKESGIKLTVIFDTEAGKTTGLVTRIMAEGRSEKARADLFWSGEIFNTVLLSRQGFLAPYDSPVAGDVPAPFRDANRQWTGTSLRSRVVAFDPRRTPREHVPTRWEDFARPEFAARTAIANPLFGTTRGHVSAMFALWGEERGKAFLKTLKDGGAKILDGNSATVRAVTEGRADFAWTDNDDVQAARRAGWSMESIAPDMGDGGILLIPCTTALLRGAPNPDGGRKLYDHLVSAEVERRLAESDWKSIPVRSELQKKMGLSLPPRSGVTFEAAADAMDAAMSAVREILLR
jgi:iron(III) transport system substrate-binding protein